MYRVFLKRFFKYKISYVVAENLKEAYKKVKKFLDEKKYGLSTDRALDKIKLLAEVNNYNTSECMLFL